MSKSISSRPNTTLNSTVWLSVCLRDSFRINRLAEPSSWIKIHAQQSPQECLQFNWRAPTPDTQDKFRYASTYEIILLLHQSQQTIEHVAREAATTSLIKSGFNFLRSWPLFPCFTLRLLSYPLVQFLSLSPPFLSGNCNHSASWSSHPFPRITQ